MPRKPQKIIFEDAGLKKKKSSIIIDGTLYNRAIERCEKNIKQASGPFYFQEIVEDALRAHLDSLDEVEAWQEASPSYDLVDGYRLPGD